MPPTGAGPLRVITVDTGAGWEPSVVARLEGTVLRVVRRCADLPEALAVATAGLCDAALVDAALRGLDGAVLDRFATAGVAVVLVDGAPGAAPDRPHPGAPVVGSAADVDEIRAALLPRPAAGSRAAVAGPDIAATSPPAVPPAADGRLVAVWGPTGAPGRSTVALNLAAELAARQVPTLLADADVYGGSQAQLLGLLDEAPGLAAAARAANAGRLSATELARLAPLVQPGLRLLSGISRPARWVELRPSLVAEVWRTARALVPVTVVDCAFCLERDDDVAFDSAAPRRNGLTLATLEAADVVLAVGRGDPVGLHRLVRGLDELRTAVPTVVPRVVVTAVRPGPVGHDAHGSVRAALARHAGVADPLLVPDDRAALDAAVRHGRCLRDVAPRSPARLAIGALADSLVGQLPVPPRAADQRFRGRARQRAKSSSSPSTV